MESKQRGHRIYGDDDFRGKAKLKPAAGKPLWLLISPTPAMVPPKCSSENSFLGFCPNWKTHRHSRRCHSYRSFIHF